MFKRISKAFWLEDSDDDLENDESPINKPPPIVAKTKPKTYGRKKISLGKIPVVTGFGDEGLPTGSRVAGTGGAQKSKQLRRSLYSPQKKAARLTKSPVPAKAKPKKKSTYTRKKRSTLKSWDIGSILKTSSSEDIDFILQQLAAQQASTAEGGAGAGGAGGGAGKDTASEILITFPIAWTTQDSFRVQGLCLKLGFSKVVTKPDVFVLKISAARGAKISADVQRIRQKSAEKSSMPPPPAAKVVAASKASASPAKKKGGNKKKRGKKKSGTSTAKASPEPEPEAIRQLSLDSPPRQNKRMSFSAAALNRMRRASFAPAQWATKFSGRGSSTSIRLSCIPPLAPAARSGVNNRFSFMPSATTDGNDEASPPSPSVFTEEDDDSLDADLSMESVEEALGAPSNVDLATRRRQSTGRLSVSSVAGDVVKGSVGYAVASVFDPLLLSHVLGFVSYRELISSCSTVSRSWHHISMKLASMVVVSRGCSDPDDGDAESGADSVVFTSWPHFVQKFPKGTFLAQGGCKTVHRVWSSVMQRWEAIAVVDVQAIEEGVAQEQFARETECSYLLSNLVAQRVCPNFIELYQVFRFCFPPTARLWGSEDTPVPKATGARLKNKPPPATKRGVFQFQRMELCDALDLEEFMRKMPEEEPQAFPVADLPAIMFQMVFSLYTARHQVALCHYDIKLLNFLVQNVRVSALDDDCEDAEPDASPNNQGLGLSYALGSETTFKLGTLPTQWSREPASCRVVKLADFGTSYFDGATANDDSDDADRKVIANGAPVDDPRFFTTLENTPIDYLILGTDAKQGFGADTWCLGLSFIHLLTGGQPYEETLESVECPAALDKALSKLWLREDRYRVLAGLDSDYPHVLQDTLYRYLVLLGFGFGTEFTHWPAAWRELRVFSVLRKHLLSGAGSTQFQRDVELYAFGRGTHEAIAFATRRLEAMDAEWEQQKHAHSHDGGSKAVTTASSSSSEHESPAPARPAAVIASLLRFDAEERPTMFELLRSSLFEGLRAETPEPANFDFYRNFSFKELPRV